MFYTLYLGINRKSMINESEIEFIGSVAIKLTMLILALMLKQFEFAKKRQELISMSISIISQILFCFAMKRTFENDTVIRE